MKAGYVEVATPDGAMPVFTSGLPGESRGAIVVIQEVFGVTAHIESLCERLSDEGWYAIAPAFFHRDGSPVVDYQEPAPGVALMGKLSAAGISIDLDAARQHLAGLGFTIGATGTVGFCMGGALALYFATTHELGAAVSFYGVGIRTSRAGLPPLLNLAPQIRCPWIGFYGEQDGGAPEGDVDELRTAVEKTPFPAEVVTYPGAGHAFNCDARPDRYNSVAAKDAWNRSLQLFAEHLR